MIDKEEQQVVKEINDDLIDVERIQISSVLWPQDVWCWSCIDRNEDLVYVVQASYDGPQEMIKPVLKMLMRAKARQRTKRK